MDKIDSLKERRILPRIPVTFPSEVSGRIVGETVNLSETGLCLALERPLLSTRTISVQIDLPFPAFFLKSQVKIIWAQSLAKNNRFLCGVHFLRLKKEESFILREALVKYKFLNSKFVFLIERLRSSLFNLKSRFDRFDAVNKGEKKRIKFIEKNKPQVYAKLDEYFKKAWKITKNFNKEEYSSHQRYYQKMLGYLLRDSIEINNFSYQKPLGYAGDFILINYFYDFCNKYLGVSLYEKLINFYTCNIPIAHSVIRRKDFFKKKLLEMLDSKNPARVLSVGSGPCRELLELLQEGRIKSPLYFDCLDFDKQALDYVRNEIEKIEPEKKSYFHLGLINKNLLSLIRPKKIESELQKYDLIYSSGVFDYLSNRVAKRMMENLYKLLNRGSMLIVTNADKDGASHRVYYEMLTEWVLNHRTKEEILNWTKDLQNVRDIKFVNLDEKNSFLFLSLRKLSD